MEIQKQPVTINFSSGLETKDDPFQLPPGKFTILENTVFEKQKLLSKRNGYAMLPALPDTTSTLATTFEENLTTVGSSIYAFSAGSSAWVQKGSFKSADIDVLSLVKSNNSQSQVDTAVSPYGLVCTVFTDNIPSAGSTTPSYKYVIADSVTGQNIIAPTVITPASGTVTGSPRVFLLKNYFVIVFTNVITATNHLQYIAINIINPSSVTSNVDITSAYTPASTVTWDGYVVNNSLYLAWNSNATSIKMTKLDSTLTLYSVITFASRVCTQMSVTADTSGNSPVIWAAFYDSAGSTGYALAINENLSTVLTPTQIITATACTNITSTATGGVLTAFFEIVGAYSYGTTAATNRISKRTVTMAGVLGTTTSIMRSVGLASKAFLVSGIAYFLTIYSSTNQPTNFLLDQSGNIIAKLAYGNARGYYILGLPSVNVTGNVAKIGYFFKDLAISVNKVQAASVTSAIYTQTGLNLATFTIGNLTPIAAEIGQNLNLTGGYLWMYDGYLPVEQGFHLWPDYVELAGSTTGGTMTAQTYFYQALYEWTDNQGNIFRSAPSIPVSVTTTGSTSSVTVNVPTLRLTLKTANPVKIAIYRASTAQATYYQVTSINAPVLNSTTTDSIAFLDTLPDSSIIGNTILYTTGGVVENIGPPACIDISLYKSRLFLIDAEDRNLLWYSKQVIEATPVEMNDLFTIYVAPTTGSQGSTGPLTCTAPMDDKLILFKNNAAYYILGNGPDNTGANNDFSEPVFITSTVGTSNKASIVFIPQGLMFQSDKGIWLLGRDLSTKYIGSPVEAFNEFEVLSALNIPGTNQVRFTLSNGVTLMYDYFYDQWGSFTGVPAITSTLYQDLHTYIDSFGRVFQENPGSYLDGSNPVLIKFQTGWMNLAGLTGFQRAYFFYLLGVYLSPHKLTLSIGYDYSDGASQQVVITPDNYSAAYGGDSLYGSGNPYGGPASLETWRVFFEQQKCRSFQLTLTESYDSSQGVTAGAGFTLSGISMVVGVKKGYYPQPAATSTG